MSLSDDILAHCRDLGFAAAGICRADPTRWREELAQWIAAGKHGTMDYLRDQLEIRLDPQLLLPGVRSIIMVADLYTARGDADDQPLPELHARIARYARGRDYHEVIKRRLHHLADTLRARFPAPAPVPGPEPLQRRFRSFVDTAPVLEREYAARAGLGWVAKHTLLIHPRLGSFMLLGGIATTLDLEPSPDDELVPDHCGTCTRCIDACPTQAITPYSVDATRCISYLTIERRDAIDPALHSAIGQWIYGCDVCQEVCPHNSPRRSLNPGTQAVGEVNPAYASTRASFDLLEVLNWNEDTRRAAFTSSAMKRATLAVMKRNAIIALGNAIAASVLSTPSLSGSSSEGSDLLRLGYADHDNSGVAPEHKNDRVDDPPSSVPPIDESSSRSAPLSLASATALLQRLRQVSEDESEPELVRLTARQVLARLDEPKTAG